MQQSGRLTADSESGVHGSDSPSQPKSWEPEIPLSLQGVTACPTKRIVFLICGVDKQLNAMV
jgi:hypothetical protein